MRDPVSEPLPPDALLTAARDCELAGEWAEAAAHYEHWYAHAVAARDARGIAEVTRRIGHVHRNAKQMELADEYFTLSFALAELLPNTSLMGRALNGIAAVRYTERALEDAELLYAQARQLAVDGGDRELVGQTEQNLAIVATIRGEAEQATAWYTSAMDHFRAVGNEHTLAVVHHNLGMLYVDLGRLDDAEVHCVAALGIMARLGDVAMTASILLNRTELFLLRGRLAEARESCDRCFEIYGRMGDELGQAEALKLYGMLYRQMGRPFLAEKHLRSALEVACRRDALLEAEVERELAVLLRQQSRNREALAALNRAHAIFTRLHARLDNDDVERRIGALEDEFFSLVKQWGESIEAKDRYTSGHCVRVADYACRIAARAGIPDDEMVWFRMGAFLHDVGKVDVPAEILNKPGRLTDEERAIIERHPVTGDEMLSTVEFPWDVRGMVRWHHERWDGAGYPDRLAGDAVPLPARILRIADVFDALTSVRSYRPPMPPEHAFQVMEEDAGGFDPALFAIFRDLLPELSPIAANAHEEALLSQRDLRG